MTGAIGDWVEDAWPEFDWSEGVAEHGAFHDVVVLRSEGVVARIADGPRHQARVAHEVAVMSTWRAIQLPCEVVRPLSPPVSQGTRTGVLTSLIEGKSRQNTQWASARTGFTTTLDALTAASSSLDPRTLPPARSWCGAEEWPALVRDRLAPRLPPGVGEVAISVVEDLLAIEAGAPRGLVHGDFGVHNLLWDGDRVTGIIDLDNSGWGDTAIDVAPLVGAFGASRVADIAHPEVLTRAMYHRAALPLQVAAAADSVGRTALRDHALNNFSSRHALRTLYDPGSQRPPG